jgi:hypothetical protein
VDRATGFLIIHDIASLLNMDFLSRQWSLMATREKTMDYHASRQ